MDEKTEELRDIFLSVAGEETVTERQERGRGSLVREGDVREGLHEVVETMRKRLDVDTERSTEDLVTIVERYYEGESDAEIAEALGEGVPESTVAADRVELHLIRDADLTGPVDLQRLRSLLHSNSEADAASVAEELDVDEATVRWYARVLEAQNERRRVADRYREAFEDVLQDRDIAERLTASLEETGLEGATEDQEVDVDL